jgi:hypothetical protein
VEVVVVVVTVVFPAAGVLIEWSAEVLTEPFIAAKTLLEFQVFRSFSDSYARLLLSSELETAGIEVPIMLE